MAWFTSAIRWLFSSRQAPPDRLISRWIFLRALALIYFSAFFSLLFQIRGLIGPGGILPAGEYLEQVARALGHPRGIWFAPTLLWFSSGPHMLLALCWAGMIASLFLLLNLWPRGMLAVCFVCFLSFVAGAQDFSGYQSDGMLLEAGFISLFLAPAGFRPGWGQSSPPSRASLLLLQWEWFRIYFESGVVKLLSHDPQWRNFTAMDEYYQNGPLPTWIGWYAQHLPHWFHAGTVFATLGIELGLVWMWFLPRRWRIACFLIVTPFEIGIILTANYTFLNYLVLSLGFLLLDDRFLRRFLPASWKAPLADGAASEPPPPPGPEAALQEEKIFSSEKPQPGFIEQVGGHYRAIKLALSAVMLSWLFYASFAQLAWMFSPLFFPLPVTPVAVLEPFRIANRYGLFAVMTRGRYEIEFQGSNDGNTWVAYPFRFKPQDLDKPPAIYAPYQPRFDWNLWFASLTTWRDALIVPRTELLLLDNDKDVLSLFAGNSFPQGPPKQVRAVIWQYWFTSMEEKRTTGRWWRREFLGLYAPALERESDGSTRAVDWPLRETPRE
ncbi:MAG TPA: lipase maturation factor family protein [Terriglobales bacterium]